jgi:putative hydrolase of the HAD superfamily
MTTMNGDAAPERRHLIFDADDTLWECNIYFEQAIEDFIDYLDHSTLDRTQVRATLDEVEHANTVTHGYGAKLFEKSLHDVYARLSERDISADDLNVIVGFSERILNQPMVLLPGVQETLEVLREHYALVMLTKGHPEEQRLKVDRSGLVDLFAHIAIVTEKNNATYRELRGELSFDPAETWMIGNSPKSDINPALANGMNAVFIPHDHTWRLEHADMATGPGQLLILERFPELTEHF